MNWNRLAGWPALSLPLIAASTLLQAAQKAPKNDCTPTAPAPCYSVEAPACDYCLGPDAVAGNPAVRPYSCNGDFVIDVAGFYWNSHQDGLTYAVETSSTTTGSGQVNIIDGHYQQPKPSWEFGFKLGVGYNTTFDGWDLDLVWTHYKGRASNQIEAETSDNQLLIPFWSASPGAIGNTSQLTVSSIESHWKLSLDLVDFELGREFWVSKRVTLRPFVGLRYARIDQHFNLEQHGGFLSGFSPVNNDFINNTNNFKSFGVRGGLDSTWNVGRGFSFFGSFALSILYGRFHIDQDEQLRQATSPFSKTEVFSTEDGFRSSKAATDLILGIQYATLFSDCRYGFKVGLGWEHHMFFNQNQLWRINRVGLDGTANGGQNTFTRSSGDLSTQGWTLNFTFDF